MEGLPQSDSFLMHKLWIFFTDQSEEITNDSNFMGKSSIPLCFVKNQCKNSILFIFWSKLFLKNNKV